MNSHFDPGNWLPVKHAGKPLLQRDQEKADFEKVLSRLLNEKIDLTKNYQDWRNIGFAIASAFGEEGRQYFQLVSTNYPNYDEKECDLQYDKCLNSKGSGITLKTFFYLAKLRGISIKNEEPDKIQTPIAQTTDKIIDNEPNNNQYNYLPDEVFSNLPSLLKECIEVFNTPIEKNVFLIGALGVLSGCMPNIEGIYHQETVYPYLYIIIEAPAGSGKGKLNWAKCLGSAIHESLVNKSKAEIRMYQRKLANLHKKRKDKEENCEIPARPPTKMLFIPANISASALIQTLFTNEGKGIMIETEIDTITNAIGQDWGNFSDVIRKAFHHETASLCRKKENEILEIKSPKLAIVLAGTHDQVMRLLPSAENGLYSRFLIFSFKDSDGFKNPFLTPEGPNLKEFFQNKSLEIKKMYEALSSLSTPMEFKFTNEQGERFTKIFQSLNDQFRALFESEFDANIRRLGLITFRIAMILSVIRHFNEKYPRTLICNEIDFLNSIKITSTLIKYAILIYKNSSHAQINDKKHSFYYRLPQEFNRQKYLTVAEECHINPKTAEFYIRKFKSNSLLYSVKYGLYSKINKN